MGYIVTCAQTCILSRQLIARLFLVWDKTMQNLCFGADCGACVADQFYDFTYYQRHKGEPDYYRPLRRCQGNDVENALQTGNQQDRQLHRNADPESNIHGFICEDAY